MFFRKRYYSKRPKFIVIPFFIMFLVSFITVGYSAFETIMEIDEFDIAIIPEEDIRITSLSLLSNSSQATSESEEYSSTGFTSNITLPNQDSSVTYAITVKNLGNVEMGILDITGLPNNLEYSINEENYKLGDKICDDTQTSKCKLGATKTVYITLSYVENGYDSLNTEYQIDLSFNFEKFFSISYVGFSNVNDLPTGILENETKIITFTNTSGIPADVSVTGATAIYSNPNLSLTNPTNNVVIEKKHSISYVLNEGIQAPNQVTSIYASETVTLLDPTKEGENFDGWYDNPEFEGTKITELSNVQTDITLYAKWNQFDYYVEEATFDGTTASVINTHLRLFSAENVNKNFRIAFTIEEYNSKYDDPNNINNNTPPTIVSSMLETGAPYPGFVFRLVKEKGATCYSMKINDSHVTSFLKYYDFTAPIDIEIVREDGVMYTKIGSDTYKQVLDYGGTIDTFDTELTIGGNINSQGKYDRVFDGKLSNVTFEFYGEDQIEDLHKYNEYRTDHSYELDGSIVFDGTNYIDTGLNLFSSENINKDFNISFTLNYVDTNESQATLVNMKDESNTKYPGFVYRFSSNRMTFAAKWPGQTDGNKPDTASTPKLVSITRRNGVIYYSVAGSTPAVLISTPAESLTEIFHSNLTFGASSKYNSTTGIAAPMRFFKGVVSDISVEILDS